jgi:hypothetical protein
MLRVRLLGPLADLLRLDAMRSRGGFDPKPTDGQRLFAERQVDPVSPMSTMRPDKTKLDGMARRSRQTSRH